MKPLIEYLVLKQSGHPRGWLGRWLSRQFSKSNIYQNKVSVEKLDVQENDKVLELGFGTGDLLEQLHLKTFDGNLYGLDHSRAMCKMVEKKIVTAKNSFTVHIKNASFNSLPYENSFFDKCIASNVIYFFTPLDVILQEIQRVLKRNGRLLLSFRELPSPMVQQKSKHGYTHYQTDEVQSQLKALNFKSIETHSEEQGDSLGSWKIVWISATK